MTTCTFKVFFIHSLIIQIEINELTVKSLKDIMLVKTKIKLKLQYQPLSKVRWLEKKKQHKNHTTKREELNMGHQ